MFFPAKQKNGLVRKALEQYQRAFPHKVPIRKLSEGTNGFSLQGSLLKMDFPYKVKREQMRRSYFSCLCEDKDWGPALLTSGDANKH